MYVFGENKEYDKNLKIIDIFEHQVAKTPEKVAIIGDGLDITYDELNEKANSLAHTLRNNGISSESIVAVMIPRSLEMMVAIIAILKAGGAYLPIDVNYPQKRIDYIIENSKCKKILTLSKYRTKVINDKLLVCVDDINSYSNVKSNLERIGSSRDLAYIIYTSGTTGNPKGVMIENRSVINRIQWMQSEYCIDETDVIMQKTPITFDVSVWELFWWMFVGAKLCLLEIDGEKDPFVISETIRKHKVSTMHFVPSMLSSFLDYIKESKENELPTLKKVFASGEELLPTQVNLFNELLGEDSNLINLYGPTEATVDVTHFPCKRKGLYKKIYIGKPVYNTRIYIVDKNLQLVSEGDAGELCIAGDQLARGYLNNEFLTAEKFIKPSFGNEDIVYRTGDLARIGEDGNIEYLGRIDSQVKIRGFRIEIGEIENVIREYGSVKDVAIVARENSSGAKYLSAYIISNESVVRKQLIDYIETFLPTYMVPEKFYLIDKFPLSANGKLDRKALTSENELIDCVEFIPPSTDIEIKLAEIWKDILGVESIGINDDFLALGGNSIGINKVRVRILELFKKNIRISDMFANTKLNELANLIEKTSSSINNFSISKNSFASENLISAPQKRIFLASQDDDTNIAYNIPIVIKVDGNLSVATLQEAFQRLVDRHSSFRTSFHVKGNDVYQKINDDILVSINERKIKEECLEQEIKNCVYKFDLSKAPLIRCFLLTLNNEEHYLIFDYHHIIADGTSTSIIMREISNYEMFTNETFSYLDYSKWLEDNKNSSFMLEQRTFWEKQLSDIDEYDYSFPYSQKGESQYSNKGGTIYFNVDEEKYKKIVDISAKYKCTPYVVMYTIYAIWISRLMNSNKIITGTVVDNRISEKFNNVIGMFVNTLLVKFDMESSMNFADVLLQTRDRIISCINNQDYQYDSLVEYYRSTTGKNLNDYLTAMFVYENTMNEKLNLNGSDCTEVFLDFGIAKFGLSFIVREDNGFNIALEYRTSIFSQDDVQRFIFMFGVLLNQIIENEKIAIADLKNISDSEEKIIVEEFNNTYISVPRNDKSIYEIFKEVALTYSDKIAVSDQGRFISYKELDILSDKVASYLLSNVQEQNVGIHMEKSILLIVALLGIVKAGKAYVPIDINAPDIRKELIIDDAKIRCAICSANVGIENDNCLTLYIENLINYELVEDYKNKNSSSDIDAYIMYTSGSTGTPKGVIITQKNIISLVSEVNYVTLSNNTKMLQTGSIAFDAMTFEVWGPLLNGGTIHMVDSETVMNVEKLGAEIAKQKINTMWLTAQLFNNLVDQDAKVFDGLNYLMIGGDIISVKHVNAVYSINDSITIINGYGPTENTTFSTCYTIPRDKEFDAFPIGKPIQNSTVYILDKQCNILPIGVVGELYVGGDGVANGYLNNVELTDEKFGFPLNNHERLYKTGDLGKWNSNGEVEFLGRKDGQIKIRGYRIELDEIKNTILKLDNIIDAVVTIKNVNGNDKYLVGYYVTSAADLGDDIGDKYVAELRKQLPEYMIPNQMIPLLKIPTTINGKIDYGSLPDVIVNDDVKVQPKTEIEKEICLTIERILKIDEVYLNDNYLRLGGSSLSATLLKMEILKRFGVEITIKDILNYKDITEISSYVENSIDVASISLIKPAEKKSRYIVAPQQKVMFIEQYMNKEDKTYNIQIHIVPKISIDVTRFEKAINQLIDKYEILRTNFEYDGTEVFQVIREKAYLKVKDFNTKDENKAFDLEKDLLLRVSVKREKGEISEIFFTIHHIITDGVSLGILFKELEQIYNGVENQNSFIQYKDYSEWFNIEHLDEVNNKQGAFWRKVYSNKIDLVKLPYDVDIKNNSRSITGGRIISFIDNCLYEDMIEFTNRNHITFYSLMMAAYSIFLHKISGKTDITVGTPMSGRLHHQLHNAIGPFVNTISMRYAVNPICTLNKFVTIVNDFNNEVYDNQEFQFDEIKDEIIKDRKNVSNLFSTMFALQNTDLSKISVFGGHPELTYINNEYILFDMNIQVYQSKEKIKIDWQYNNKKFYEETIKDYLEYYTKILSDIVYEDSKTIDNIHLIDVVEDNSIDEEFDFSF